MTNNNFANSKLTGACLNSSSPSHHHKLLLSYIASVRIQFKTVSSIPMKTSSLSVNKIWFKPLKPLWLNAPFLQYIVSTLLPYLNQKGNPCQTLVWIKSVAQDCEYSCPSCQADLLQSIHVKDQFIWGLHNETSQTDILAKAECLKSLEHIIKHAEAFESALHDQTHLHQQTDSAAWISAYKKSRSNASKPSSGYGTTNHTNSQCYNVCRAWGKQCLNCNKQNLFAKMCHPTIQSQGFKNALIPHLQYDNTSDTYTTMHNNNMTEIPALISFHEWHKHKSSITLPIFPDSGAGLCLAGLKLLQALGVTKDNLIPCNKIVTAVGVLKYLA